MKQKVDWNLKFLREIFGLECLHFGYWEKGEELNLENLKKSQQRYIEKLLSAVPKGVKTVLDVGCGTGEVAKNLLSENYLVECLSPNEYQYNIFKKNLPNVRCYLTKFGNFNID